MRHILDMDDAFRSRAPVQTITRQHIALRVRDQLTEICANDLRFTTEEAAAFLSQVMGLDLSAEEAALL